MHRTPRAALTLAFTVAMALAALPVAAPAQTKGTATKSARDPAREQAERPNERPLFQDASMAMMLAVQGNVRPACEAMDAVLKDARLAALPGKERAETLMLGSFVYSQCDRMSDAVKQAQASAAIERTPNAVMMIAAFGEAAGQHDVSAEALVAFAREWPKDTELRTVQIAWGNFRAMADTPAKQRAFLQALFDARLNPPDTDASDLWFELARLHLDAGDVASAKAVAAEVKGLRNATRMRVDRRFDPVLAEAPQLGDYRAQAARLLDVLRAKQKAAPRAMPLRMLIAEEMVLLGDYPVALAYIDGTLAEVRGGNEDKWQSLPYAAFLMRARATASMRQGKAQQAIEDFEMASMFVPPGGVDVPRLMLADQLCDLGRPKDADAAADIEVGDTGWLANVQHIIGVCTAVGSGDIARARKLVDELRGMVKPNERELLVTAYLRLGDVDAAAPLFIALLDDAATRNEMLVWAQKDRRLEPMPGLVDYRKAFDAMIARPDVQAALQKHGRVLEWDVYLGLE